MYMTYIKIAVHFGGIENPSFSKDGFMKEE